jgi:hypothetical protein
MAAAVLGTAAAAQHQAGNTASSATYFMAAIELGSGDDADTFLYRLQSSQGSGVVVEPDASSTTYRMRGGFFGALTSPVLGQPWLTGATPFFVKQVGNPNITLHGTELWLGPTPTVTLGGQTATTILRTVHQMVVTVPDQPVPGYQPVVFSNLAGTTRLNEGIGVLPMIEKREPLNGADPNYLRIHALFTDIVLLVLSGAPSVGIQLFDFRHLLLLDPGQVVFLDAFFIGDPDGKMTIPLPPYPSGLVWVQALAFTLDPGYAPASWTNAVML